MRTLLLFGSKVSPAPDVVALTKAVLHAPMYCMTCGDFARGQNPQPVLLRDIDYSRLVPRLLKRIQIEFARYQQRKPDDITYEEIGSICWQLMREQESGLLTNPALGAFCEQLEREFSSELPTRLTTPEMFAELVRGAVKWLTTSIILNLRDCNVPPMALEDFFRRFRLDSSSFAIATLNHDVLLEKALNGFGALNLGFGGSSPLQNFDPTFLHGDNGLRLIKLHGSIDWRWAPDRREYVRVLDFTVPAARNLGDPILLIGTNNKPEEYTREIFPHFFHAFQNELYQCSRLLVSGYGFKDGGVNRRIIDWLHYCKGGKMLVIHPDPESLHGSLVPYSMRQALETATVVDPDDSLSGFGAGVSILPIRFEQAAQSPWDRFVEGFLAS